MENTLILISGHGATGKTTLAKKISDEFKIPFISPDGVKEIMWNNLGWEHNSEEYHKVGATSFELTYYFIHASLSQGKSLIIDAHFHPEKNNERLNEIKKKYNCRLIQIHCKADRQVIIDRFKDRVKSENYHKGHKFGIENIYNGTGDFFNQVGLGNKLLDIDGKTIEIDTTNPEAIDYAEIFEFIKNAG